MPFFKPTKNNTLTPLRHLPMCLLLRTKRKVYYYYVI